MRCSDLTPLASQEGPRFLWSVLQISMTHGDSSKHPPLHPQILCVEPDTPWSLRNVHTFPLPAVRPKAGRTHDTALV